MPGSSAVVRLHQDTGLGAVDAGAKAALGVGEVALVVARDGVLAEVPNVAVVTPSMMAVFALIVTTSRAG